MMKKLLFKIFFLVIIFSLCFFYIHRFLEERHLLQKIIERLSATSRIAEVLVTETKFSPQTNKTYTTIKFVEYDSKLTPLNPKYFTFSENIIQFQAMVLRFDDFYVKRGHPLKGKSAYIFMKAFALTDKGAEIYLINSIHKIPSGYEVEGAKNRFESKLWQRFWEYALDSKKASKIGIKNAQIEAPGTKFIPGILYTIKIEHHGGLRIESQPIPLIFKQQEQISSHYIDDKTF